MLLVGNYTLALWGLPFSGFVSLAGFNREILIIFAYLIRLFVLEFRIPFNMNLICKYG